MYLVSIGGAVDLLGLAGDVQGEGQLGRVRGGVARSNHAAHHLFKDNTTPQYTTMQQQNSNSDDGWETKTEVHTLGLQQLFITGFELNVGLGTGVTAYRRA